MNILENKIAYFKILDMKALDVAEMLIKKKRCVKRNAKCS